MYYFYFSKEITHLICFCIGMCFSGFVLQPKIRIKNNKIGYLKVLL